MEASAFIKKKNGVETPEKCGLCLTTCEDLEPLPNDESWQYEYRKPFDCTGVQANLLPGVPLFLCTMCESRLDEMYAFRWRCNENIALVNGFTEKRNTVKIEADISTDHLGHSADQTVGAELLIKTAVTTPDGANDAIQRSCTVPHVNGTHECCGNQADDLFEAEENPIAFKLENGDVDEQDNSPTNPSELICQAREDRPVTTNMCVNDSASETIQNGVPYVCNTCSKAFKSRINLTQHKKIHNKDQHRQCPHCTSKFAKLYNLNNHIRIHTGEKPYLCEVCGQAFRTLSSLTRHKKIHNKDQQHQCPHCTSTFAQLSNFNSHIRIHTGEKPFVCKICTKAFRTSSVLSRHSKIHKKNDYEQCQFV